MSNTINSNSIPTSMSITAKSPNSEYSIFDKENFDFQQNRPYQILPPNYRGSVQPLGERMEELSSHSTNDSPFESSQNSRLDEISLSPSIFKYVNTKECQHINRQILRCAYCKDCGVFLPKNASKTYRESMYSARLLEYPDEVYAIMLQKEAKNREYHVNAPHLQFRKTIIDWIFQVGQDLKLFPETTSSIVSYMDTLLCRVEVAKENIQLVTLSCLILATKFLEMDSKVPPLKEAYTFCQGMYSIETFKQSENFILKQLDWELKVVSPYQFIQFYLSKGCLFSSDKTMMIIDDEVMKYMRKYSECFTNLSMHDYAFNKFPSHIVACASIASTRKLIGISPLWNSELEELTRTSWETIEPCFNMLYSYCESSFPELFNLPKALIERKLSQEPKREETAMAVEGQKTPIKKAYNKVISKVHTSSLKKKPSSSKKMLKKKNLARLRRKNCLEEKLEKAETSKMAVEPVDSVLNTNKKTDCVNRNLIY